MKKGLRITLWILAAILILLLGLVVAVQSPAVQTALARKVVERVADKIDGDIHIGHIAVRPFDAVTLEDVVITDRNPYIGGEFPRQDTLARIGSLSGRFSLKGLLHKERISVSRLKMTDAELNLVLEPGTGGKEVMDNISRIFRLSPNPDKPKQDFGDLLEAGQVDIEDFTFRMFNHVGAARMRERGLDPLPADVIDWNDLEVKVDVHASGLLVKDGEIIAGNSNSVTIDNDPTAHAEVNTIRQACKKLGTFDLTGSTIYTSCEPCPMCLGAIYWARISRIFYGNTRKDARDIQFADDFIYEELDRPLEARTVPIMPLLRDEALQSFRKWREKSDKTEY